MFTDGNIPKEDIQEEKADQSPSPQGNENSKATPALEFQQLRVQLHTTNFGKLQKNESILNAPRDYHTTYFR